MIRSRMKGNKSIERQIEGLGKKAFFGHDKYLFLALHEALESYKKGNFAVGAVIVDKNGSVLVKGNNRVFVPYHRSDRHAEMVVINDLEEKHAHEGLVIKAPLTLYSTLEPCPMCLSRFLSSKVDNFYYAVGDTGGGMVKNIDHLPYIWQDFRSGRVIEEIECDPDIKDLCRRLFESSDERIAELGLWESDTY